MTNKTTSNPDAMTQMGLAARLFSGGVFLTRLLRSKGATTLTTLVVVSARNADTGSINELTVDTCC